ncbi:MAG: hypothetical protein IJY15_07525 [Thermoguttaceae bacterium]|nr:hypothetical protein [Thermoguttaceae bacterium]
MRSIKFLRRVLDLVYAMDERENWARCELADGGVYIALPPTLAPKKLERLRWLDALGFRELDTHVFANFLPDGERPADVTRAVRRKQDDACRTA